MPETTAPASPPAEKAGASLPPIFVDLRNPYLAGVLAWLIPGAGHFYQRRYEKGVIFSVCILGLFFYGLILGEGKVVHTGGTDRVVRGNWMAIVIQRWPIGPQLCTGLPALPAVIQHYRLKGGGEPLWGGWMAPPRTEGELSLWQERLNVRYDVGMLYTIVAGLLNILAIYDATCGPVVAEGDEPAVKRLKPKKGKA